MEFIYELLILNVIKEVDKALFAYDVAMFYKSKN